MNYKLIGLMVLLLTIAGCTGETTSTMEGYYSCFGDDTTMIDAYFAEYAPMSSEANTYQPGEGIDVEVILENKMPIEISEGKVKVRLMGEAAVDTTFSGAKVVTNPELYAVDQQTCMINEEEIELGPISYLKNIDTKISKDIEGQLCYEMPVEVRGFLYFTEDETEIGETLPPGSNPPSGIQVTAIEQEIVDTDRDSSTGDLRFQIYIENVGEGIVVEDLDECFQYRETGYREEFDLSIEGPYRPDCPDDVKLSRDTKEDVITCYIYDVDIDNLGDNANEITITLDGFAYEEDIDPVTIWLEP